MCFYLSEDENGNGNLLLNATLVNACPRLPLHQSQVSFENKPTSSTMKKKRTLNIWPLHSISTSVKKQMTLRCYEHLCIYYGQEVSIEKNNFLHHLKEAYHLIRDFFSHLFNWFQLFSSDKKISPKVAVHDKKKGIIWKGCIDGFSYSSLIFSYFIF